MKKWEIRESYDENVHGETTGLNPCEEGCIHFNAAEDYCSLRGRGVELDHECALYEPSAGEAVIDDENMDCVRRKSRCD